MSNRLKDYGLYIFSLILMGLGIALITKANLGTSAVSSVAYVLSKIYPSLSFGFFTFIINVLYVFIQVLILRKDFPKYQYVQVLVGPILGLFIDLSMFVLAFIVEPPFIVSILILCGGCLFIALSIISQIKADVIINPTEAIIKVISEKLNIEFSKVKVSFDSGLVVVALILSLIVFKRIIGLGLGTLVSAFLVGYFLKFLKRKEEVV
ncbi:MAG: YitT family protein [Erysipelothrix sp.]|nr:YitT family protein [Erysipelothrix sp.]